MYVIANSNLKGSFEELQSLVVASKSNVHPTTWEEAIDWIQSYPDVESRKARKILTFGIIYGASDSILNAFVKRPK